MRTTGLREESSLIALGLQSRLKAASAKDIESGLFDGIKYDYRH